MKIKKPLKTAGFFGIIIIASAFFFGIINQILIHYGSIRSISLSSIIYTTIVSISSIFFYNGFIVLGKKYNSKILVVVSWIAIIFTIIFFLFSLGINLNKVISSPHEKKLLIPESSGYNSFEDYNNSSNQLENWLGIIFAYIFFSILMGIYLVFVGIGLLKIGEKVDYAKTSGIMEIIAGASLIIIIGWFITFISTIFEIIMFFKISKKLEKKIK